MFDLKKDGPTVFEVPPGVMGPLDDHNFLFVADIGPTGKDLGKGGKYLLLPPDYEGDVPEGYFVVRLKTYMNFSFIRANAAVVGFGDKALEHYRKHAKVYPLNTGPRPPIVTNVTGKGSAKFLLIKPDICIIKSLSANRQVFRIETTSKQDVSLTCLNSP